MPTKPWKSLARVLASTALAVLVSVPAVAAEMLTIETRNGEVIRAERAYPTYTTLVLLVPGPDMRLLPNEQVKSINGVPFEQAYWTEERPIYGEAGVPPTAAATGAAAPQAVMAAPALLPLETGTSRQYKVSGTRTTWVRLGRQMLRKPTEPIQGLARVTVVGAAPEGPVAVRESQIERTGGGPAREVQTLQLLEKRESGYFLVGYGLGAEPGQTAVDVPPQLWPGTLEIGQTWVVGPFKRLGAYQVARMQVVGRESVTVPAGTFAEAFKVQGFGHVFAGINNLAAGRLITDNGTIETTTWIVPGVGPVREERKVHLHQDFFPSGQTGETPFVVEEITTRELTAHDAGKRP